MKDTSSLAEELFVAELCKRFAGNFSAAARKLLGKDLNMRRIDLLRTSCAEFLNSIEEPTCCFLLQSRRQQSKPQAAFYLEFSAQIAFVMVGRLLSDADEGAFVPARPLTAIESRLLKRVADLAADGLSRAWPDGFLPAFAAMEHCGIVSAAEAPKRRVTAVTFELTLGRCVGPMRLAIPEGSAPSVELAGENIAASQGPGQPSESPLELTAVVEGATISAEQFADLTADDIITIETAADGEVIVKVAGIAKFAARLGTCNGRRAVTITRRL